MGDAISPRRAARRRARLYRRPAAGRRRLRRRHGLRAGDRLSQGEQPHQGRHGDGRRVLRHVRPRPRALHQDPDRRASRPHPVRRHAGRRPGATSSRPAIIALVVARASCSSNGATCCCMPSIRSMRARSACRSRLLHYGLLALLSLTIVGALKAVGIILAIAMLIAPGAIAFLLTQPLQRMLADRGRRSRCGARSSASISASSSTARRRRPSCC